MRRYLIPRSLPNKSKQENSETEALPQALDKQDVSAVTPVSVMRLQRVIGNKAVQHLLVQKRLPNQTIQLDRQPYGLEAKGSVDPYTDYALKLRQTDPKMSLTDFAKKLTENISQDLTKRGIPQVKITLKTHRTDGEFNQKDWELIVDPSKFDTQKKSIMELGKLSDDDVINATGTIYHEARHAEQDFLVARMLAGKNKTPEEINKETGIPVEVANKAKDNKLTKASGNAEQIAEAETLFDVMYGDNKTLLAFVIDYGHRIEEVGQMIEQVSTASHSKTVAETDKLIKDLNTWSKSVSQPEVVRLSKKAKKSSVDQQMHTDLKNINKQLAGVTQDWNKIKKSDIDAVLDFGDKLRGLSKVVDTAYRNIPSEKDAYKVEGMVKSRMEGSLKAKSK